jgi:hypothetical protein
MWGRRDAFHHSPCSPGFSWYYLNNWRRARFWRHLTCTHALAECNLHYPTWCYQSRRSSEEPRLILLLKFTRSERMYGFTYVLEARHHPMCWFRGVYCS